MDDFVNRQDLLDGIEELKQSPWFKNGEDKQDIQHYGYLERKEAVEVVTDLCIKKEPSVKPKEKTGRWIERKLPMMIHDWKCDQCRMVTNERTNFCPNCGAKMVSE